MAWQLVLEASPKKPSRRRHQVFTPTLTGLGERSHLNAADVNLSTHIADIVNLLRWEDLSNVILCGHSYAGMVVSGVADRVPERIRTLVYLDAFVPEDPECVFDLHPPESAQQIRLQAHTSNLTTRRLSC